MAPSEQEELQKAILRLNARVLGLALGFLLGGGLFVATNWLVLKGGENVGFHLGLLGQYFPGYSVSFVGSLVGFVYAFIVGFGVGSAVAYAYNYLTRS